MKEVECKLEAMRTRGATLKNELKQLHADERNLNERFEEQSKPPSLN